MKVNALSYVVGKLISPVTRQVKADRSEMSASEDDITKLQEETVKATQAKHKGTV